jgi:hypothetical protein
VSWIEGTELKRIPTCFLKCQAEVSGQRSIRVFTFWRLWFLYGEQIIIWAIQDQCQLSLGNLISSVYWLYKVMDFIMTFSFMHMTYFDELPFYYPHSPLLLLFPFHIQVVPLLLFNMTTNMGYSFLLSLSYFALYNGLQFYPFFYKWQFHFSLWLDKTVVYIHHILLSMCWWTPRLLWTVLL